MDTINTALPAKKSGGFSKWAIIIAIVIVLNLFFNYAISLVYKAPAYDDYMKQAGSGATLIHVRKM